MGSVYKKINKIKYNNNIFQIVANDKNKLGFFKIVIEKGEEKYIYPTAQEFLHLSSVLNTNNSIKF